MKRGAAGLPPFLTDMKPSLVLIGFMGAGKTSVANRLAKLYDYSAVDLDTLIEEASGMSIEAIFAAFGEVGFRELERQQLAQLDLREGRVLSTGGGVVTQERNWPLLQRCGTVVYLRASLTTLLQRIGSGRGRPLALKGEEHLVELLESRLPKYENADIVIDTDGRTPDEVAREIMRMMEQRKR